MNKVRIAILGRRPGGLFAAALMKNSDSGREVTVFERNRAEDTFGFGVVFSDATLKGIDDVDPVLRTALSEHGVHWDSIEVRLRGERITCGDNVMAAVERKSLLADLQKWAIGTRVDLRFSTTPELDELLDED
jgi:anthraniloyl-CoA monooxygenase